MADEIRYLGDVRRLELQPGDRLVLKVSQRLPQDIQKRLTENLQAFAPEGVPVLVLDAGMDLAVLAADGPDSAQMVSNRLARLETMLADLPKAFADAISTQPVTVGAGEKS